MTDQDDMDGPPSHHAEWARPEANGVLHDAVAVESRQRRKQVRGRHQPAVARGERGPRPAGSFWGLAVRRPAGGGCRKEAWDCELGAPTGDGVQGERVCTPAARRDPGMLAAQEKRTSGELGPGR